MSAAEDKVRALNKLRAEVNRLESGMCSMRLGGQAELQFKDVWWRGMVTGGGWTSQKAEPLPAGTSREFYDFLGAKMLGLEENVRMLEDELEGLGA